MLDPRTLKYSSLYADPGDPPDFPSLAGAKIKHLALALLAQNTDGSLFAACVTKMRIRFSPHPRRCLYATKPKQINQGVRLRKDGEATL